MSVIPVRMVRVSVIDGYKIGAMLDMEHYTDQTQDTVRQISELNEHYNKTVESVKKLFYDKSGKNKKNIPSPTYYKAGRLLLSLVSLIHNKFEIINYTAALSRDLGFSKGYIRDLIAIAKSFNSKDIIDDVPFAHYRILNDKQNVLKKNKRFAQEIKHLNHMGSTSTLLGRDHFKKYLTSAVHDFKTQPKHKQQKLMP